MRRTYLTLFAILTCTLSKSQNDFKPETSYGFNGGVNFSTVSFLPKVKQTNLIGGLGGVSFRHISEKHFGFILELNLSQRGWKESLSDSTLNYSRTLNYLEIPFLTHLYFGKRKFRFFINAGPKIAILLNDKETRNFSSNTEPEHGKSIDNLLDYGICAGSGFEIRTKIGSFILEGRYNYGLSDVFNNSKKDFFTRSSNQVPSAQFTYLIHLK